MRELDNIMGNCRLIKKYTDGLTSSKFLKGRRDGWDGKRSQGLVPFCKETPHSLD